MNDPLTVLSFSTARIDRPLPIDITKWSKSQTFI